MGNPGQARMVPRRPSSTGYPQGRGGVTSLQYACASFLHAGIALWPRRTLLCSRCVADRRLQQLCPAAGAADPGLSRQPIQACEAWHPSASTLDPLIPEPLLDGNAGDRVRLLQSWIRSTTLRPRRRADVFQP